MLPFFFLSFLLPLIGVGSTLRVTLKHRLPSSKKRKRKSLRRMTKRRRRKAERGRALVSYSILVSHSFEMMTFDYWLYNTVQIILPMMIAQYSRHHFTRYDNYVHFKQFWRFLKVLPLPPPLLRQSNRDMS